MLNVQTWICACLGLQQFNCRVFSAECVKEDVERKVIKKWERRRYTCK